MSYKARSFTDRLCACHLSGLHESVEQDLNQQVDIVTVREDPAITGGPSETADTFMNDTFVDHAVDFQNDIVHTDTPIPSRTSRSKPSRWTRTFRHHQEAFNLANPMLNLFIIQPGRLHLSRSKVTQEARIFPPRRSMVPRGPRRSTRLQPPTIRNLDRGHPYVVWNLDCGHSSTGVLGASRVGLGRRIQVSCPHRVTRAQRMQWRLILAVSRPRFAASSGPSSSRTTRSRR